MKEWIGADAANVGVVHCKAGEFHSFKSSLSDSFFEKMGSNSCLGHRSFIHLFSHFLSGKGRTGLMISCFLIQSGIKATAKDALDFFGARRTHDGKGVTIPSQIRYVGYFELYKTRSFYTVREIDLVEVYMRPVPSIFGLGD